MATVSASLRMFDMMTRPLQQVNSTLSLTVGNMDRVANAANQNINMASHLNSVSEAAEITNASLNNLTNNQNKLNNSFNRGANTSIGLLGNLKGLAAAYLGFQAVKSGIKSTIGGAMGLQQQLFTLQGIMGNKDVATAYFNNLQKKANESVFGFEDFAANARKFMQFTKNTNSLDKLANLSERLTLMDPTQGLEGAGFAMKEAMSGDFTSLKERFGFGKADAEILKASKSMDEFISKFDKLLAKKGFTESMLQQYNNSAAAQFDNLKSNFKTAMAQAGDGALEVLAPVITRLNNAFSNDSFQPFFNGLSNSITGVVNLVLWLADGIQWLGSVFSSVFPYMAPVIFGIVAAYGAYWLAANASAFATWAHTAATRAYTAATALATRAQAMLNATLAFNPISLVIGLITGLVVALGIATAYSETFREGFANAFQGVANACATAFGAVVQTVENALNWIINKLNSLMEKVNKATQATASLWGGSGTNFRIDNVDFSGYKAFGEKFYRNIGSSGANAIRNFSADNIKNSIKNAMGLGDLSKGVPQAKMSNMPDMAAWNKMQGPGQLSIGGLDDGSKKHLKNIDDKIDVSNEHLEMMRDLAEKDSIQNFVTLTPTVQVTTGDIKEEADINKIISKIESYMENELVSSAEGVYA